MHCPAGMAYCLSHLKCRLPLPCRAADVDGSQPKQYKVHTLAGLIQPNLLADGQVCSCAGGFRATAAACDAHKSYAMQP